MNIESLMIENFVSKIVIYSNFKVNNFEKMTAQTWKGLADDPISTILCSHYVLDKLINVGYGINEITACSILYIVRKVLHDEIYPKTSYLFEISYFNITEDITKKMLNKYLKTEIKKFDNEELNILKALNFDLRFDLDKFEQIHHVFVSSAKPGAF